MSLHCTSREEKRRGHVQTGQRRNQHGRAEHGEHVLQAENQHPGSAEDARVVYGPVNGVFVVHSITLSL